MRLANVSTFDHIVYIQFNIGCNVINGCMSTYALFSHLVLHMLKSVTSKSPFYAKEQIDTSWPPGALPRRLACAPDGSNVMLAAASRFGLFQAELIQRSGFEKKN